MLFNTDTLRIEQNRIDWVKNNNFSLKSHLKALCKLYNIHNIYYNYKTIFSANMGAQCTRYKHVGMYTFKSMWN